MAWNRRNRDRATLLGTRQALHVQGTDRSREGKECREREGVKRQQQRDCATLKWATVGAEGTEQIRSRPQSRDMSLLPTGTSDSDAVDTLSGESRRGVGEVTAGMFWESV